VGSNEDLLSALREKHIPVVMMDRYCPGVETDYVGTDNYDGAFSAVAELAHRGFECIHFVTTDQDVTSLQERYQGYTDALSEFGLHGDTFRVPAPLPTSPHFDPSYDLARRKLPGIEKPCAIFAANSSILAGVLQAMDDGGVSHDGLALACFDGPYVSFPEDLLFVKVVQPLEDVGRQSVVLALDRSPGEAITPVRIKPQIQVINDIVPPEATGSRG
jgi:LacI family transcriptional regulator